MDTKSAHNNFKGRYFTGIEVEQTAMYGKPTLFVVGDPDFDGIQQQLDASPDIRHIYFGSNMSFNAKKLHNWEAVIMDFLREDYWCTLDFDIQYVEDVLETEMVERHRFIPMISAKLPYIDQLGYNAVLKLDDTDFKASNPGVWCHRVRDLMTTDSFTDWSNYEEDEPV
jgi:hypothetical protein